MFLSSIRPQSSPRFSSDTQTAPCSIKVFASNRNWVDPMAVTQLKQVATLPGMVHAAGMPDLHPSRGIPNGAVFATADQIYPHLIGNDIGCGMSLFQSGLKQKDVKLDKLERKLSGLEDQWDGDIAEWLNRHEAESTPFDKDLGTIGGGNHFAELQVVNQIEDPQRFAELGLDPKGVFSLIHSGSRGYGQHVLDGVLSQRGTQGIPENSPEAAAYLKAHNNGVKWAFANRSLIAERLFEALKAKAKLVMNNCHNLLEPALIAGRNVWLHRKGAAPADRGVLMIPGSRGTLSYLVEPVGDGEVNLKSLAHGAGRKAARTGLRDKLSKLFSPEQLTRTALGGRVICEDKDMLYEEAPEAYKNIERVIDDLKQHGLIRVIASFRPILTYKVRRPGVGSDD